MSRARRAAFLASLLAAALLAPLLLRIGMADLRLQHSPQAALDWWPQHGAALAARAQQAALSGDDAAADAAARALLARHALAGIGHRVLAQTAAAQGDEARAALLFRHAARRAPRDRVAHAWLVNHAAMHGDFAAAVAHLDQLLRMAPGLLPDLSPTLASFAALPPARAALLRQLGAHPTPWRAAFLSWFARQPGSEALLSEVFAPLRSAPQPLLEGERGAWVDRLLREARIGEAYYVWVDGLDAAQRQHLGNVFDGGFELAPASAAGFGWEFGRIPGAAIHTSGTAGAEGQRALVVEFHDRRVAFAHVQQRLALAPGRYRFHGRVRSDGLRNERGLHWVLSCASGPQLAETPRFTGTIPWRDFDVALEVPAVACPGQLLQLRLAARIAPEQMIGGRILFDGLSIRSAAD